jgi:hypothetical protein
VGPRRGVACANLAVAESDHPALVQARPALSRAWQGRELDESAMCARCSWCGSGPTPPGPSAFTRRTTPSSSSSFERSASSESRPSNWPEMTTGTELVELMELHLGYGTDERAHVVHCRCGSRLPWADLPRHRHRPAQALSRSSHDGRHVPRVAVRPVPLQQH